MSKRSKSKSAAQRKATPSIASPATVVIAEPMPRVSTAYTGSLHPAPDVSSQQASVAISGMPGPALARLSTMLNATPVAGFAAAQEQAPVVSYTAALSEIEAALDEQPGLHIIAMYQSPWDAVLGVGEELLPDYLPEWLDYHSGLLRLRQMFVGRLLLVSGKRLDDSAQLLFEEVHSICGHSTAFDGEAAAAAAAIDRHTVLRAKSFEWIAPDYWDVYEALESCAWLGNGEPEYRDSLPALDPADLSEVVADWRNALGLPGQVEELHGQLRTQQERTATVEAELLEARGEVEAVRQQVTHLQSQYEAAQETLSRQADEARMRVEASEAEKRALQNRLGELEASQQKQSEETKKQEQALRAAEERAKESSAESELLLAQLHQVQESLESTFIEGQEATRQAIAVRTELEQAKSVLTGQVAKLQGEIAKAEEVSKSLAAEKAAFASQLGKLQTDKNQAEVAVKSLTAEKAALTTQVGKLQSEIQAQATQAAGNVKALTAEAEKQRAALQAEKIKLTADVGRLTEELAKAAAKSKAVEAELQQKSKAAGEQDAKLRATLGSLETRVKEAESEAELLLVQLHHVQEELERYFIKSQDATRALERSTESFNRARRVVAQLTKVRTA